MKEKTILVAVPPGKTQEGLQVLLAGLPGIKVMVVGDPQSALQALDTCPFDLLILDDTLSQAIEIIYHLHDRSTISLVLTENVESAKKMQKAGATETCLKGHPAKKIILLITKLLEENNELPYKIYNQ